MQRVVFIISPGSSHPAISDYVSLLFLHLYLHSLLFKGLTPILLSTTDNHSNPFDTSFLLVCALLKHALLFIPFTCIFMHTVPRYITSSGFLLK